MSRLVFCAFVFSGSFFSCFFFARVFSESCFCSQFGQSAFAYIGGFAGSFRRKTGRRHNDFLSQKTVAFQHRITCILRSKERIYITAKCPDAFWSVCSGISNKNISVQLFFLCSVNSWAKFGRNLLALGNIFQKRPSVGV
jgi:hypothetical protein